MSSTTTGLLVIAGLALAAIAPPSPAAAPSGSVHLFNGGFEHAVWGPGAPIPGWAVVPGSAGVARVVAGAAFQGRQCLRLAETGRQTSLLVRSRLHPAVAGARYAVACRVFNESGDGWLYLEFWADAETRLTETHAGAGVVGRWAPIRVTAVAPPGTRYVSAALYSSVGNVGVSRFDAVALEGPAGEGKTVSQQTPFAPVGWDTAAGILDIGSRLEPLMDDFLVERMAGVELRLHEPRREEVALTFDAPWEGSTSAYFTVFRDDDRYRLYFRGSDHDPKTEAALHPEVTSYAESPDGIHWSRPSLGLFDFNSSRDNSIVMAGEACHNFAPFKDPNPACPADQRYKALGGTEGGLLAFVSPDGIHWRKLVEQKVITQGAFDSQNLAFYDALRGLYFCYLRDFHEGVRDVRVCTSHDFVHWTFPEWLNHGDAPPEHLYTNATTPYFRAPQLFIALHKRFVPDRTLLAEHGFDGISDGVMATSRDGITFHRWPEALIRPGLDRQNWVERCNMPAWGIVPTGPAEMSIYASEHYRLNTNRLRRLSLRTDGFVSAHAAGAVGELMTRPFRFSGGELALNVATSAAGGVQVEIQSADGRPLPGFALADCPPIFGDSIERVAAWRGGPDVSALQGRPVRLRFAMRDADLYALQFRPRGGR